MTKLHLEAKLYTILAFLSAIGLRKESAPRFFLKTDPH